MTKTVAQDRGSTSLELVVIAPALLALAALVIAAGRIALAEQSVQSAAWQAARDTTLQRTPAAGAVAGRNTAARILTSENLSCVETGVAVDAAALALPVGRSGAVAVEVTCRVRLSDLGLPGLLGSKTLRATATTASDPWTARP